MGKKKASSGAAARPAGSKPASAAQAAKPTGGKPAATAAAATEVKPTSQKPVAATAAAKPAAVVKTAKHREPGMLQLGLILCAISAICALLLGAVNIITVDPIEQAKKEKTAKAMAAVLPADTYEQVEYTGGDPLVLAVYQAGDAGYVVEVGPSGFAGLIDMVVGVDTDGNVTGMSVIKTGETSGLGTKANDPLFKEQYNGKPGPFSVTKDGGDIQAITGATITSRAASKGINAALDAVKTLG